MAKVLCVLKCMEQLKLRCILLSQAARQDKKPVLLLKRDISKGFGVEKKVDVLLDFQLELLNNNFKMFLWARKYDVWSVISLLERTGISKDMNSTFLLQCCGKSMIEATPVDRSKLLYRVWSVLQSCGHHFTVLDYNVLLQGYLDNKITFVPQAVLNEMANNNVQPNYNTYLKLIDYCCQKQNIKTALAVIENMRRSVKMKPDIINYLIKMQTSISDSKEKEAVKNIIGAVFFSGSIYTASIYDSIKRNDLKMAEEIINACSLHKKKLYSKHTADVIIELLKNSHIKLAEFVMEITTFTNKLTNETVVLEKLINLKRIYYALRICIKIINLQASQSEKVASIEFFLSELIKNQTKINHIILVCDIFAEKKYVKYPLFIALKYTHMYYSEKQNLKLLEICASKRYPIRAHLFWPILSKRSACFDLSGVLSILNLMVKRFKCPLCIQTLHMYPFAFNMVWQNVKPLLINIGIPLKLIDNATVLHLLSLNKIAVAANYISKYPNIYWNEDLQDELLFSFCKRNDVSSYITICEHLYELNTKSYQRVSIEAQLLYLLELQPSYKKHIINVLKRMSAEGIQISKDAVNLLQCNLEAFIGDTEIFHNVTKTSENTRHQTENKHAKRYLQGY